MEYARQHNLDVVSSLVKIVSPDGHPVLSLEGYENWLNQCLSPEEILAARFIELPIPNPTILAKREVFELKYRHGNFPEDYDMWLRAAACGFRIGKVPRTLYWWTDHPNRLTRNQSIYTKAAFINAKKEHLVNGPLQGVTQCDFWGAGAEGKSWILWFQKLGIHIRTLVDVHPGKIGQTIHGIPVISPDQIPTAPLFPIFIAVGVPEGAARFITSSSTTFPIPRARMPGFLPDRALKKIEKNGLADDRSGNRLNSHEVAVT